MAKLEFISQIKNFYKNLNTLQKILIPTAVAGVIFLIVFLVVLSSKPTEYSVLYHSLDQAEAAKIVDILKAQGIKYELKDNGSTILVDKEKINEVRLNLAKEGLPETGVIGYEIFDRTNLGMSEFVQKLNYRRALEGELAKTIKGIEEVKNARVHIVIPEKAIFEKDQKEPTASVTLQLKAGKSIPKASVQGIQNLVASSIEGMVPEAVTVIDQRGKILSEQSLDKASVAGLTAAQHQQQVSVEQYLINKVQSLLDGVLGPGNSEVRVNTELDFTKIERTITDYDPERQVVRSEQQISDITRSVDTVSTSEVLDPTIPNTNTTIRAVYPHSANEREQRNIISNYEVKQTVERIVEGVGNIKRLTVSVMVNHIPKVTTLPDGKKVIEKKEWDEEQKRKIEDIVANAIGFDRTRGDQITVETMDFESNNLLEEEVQQQQPKEFYQNPDFIKLVLLIVAILITLYVMYKVLQSKQIKEKMRVALSLPETIKIEEEEELEEEEKMEEIDLESDQLMLMPAELPEQLLLETEKHGEEVISVAEDETELIDKESLAARAKAKLEEAEPIELSEETLLKLEIKEKVEEYFEEKTPEAVKLIRMVLSQDVEERPFAF